MDRGSLHLGFRRLGERVNVPAHNTNAQHFTSILDQSCDLIQDLVRIFVEYAVRKVIEDTKKDDDQKYACQVTENGTGLLIAP